MFDALTTARVVVDFADGTTADVYCGADWEALRASGKRPGGLSVAFRGHVVPAVPAGAAGYFYRCACIADFGGGPTHSFLLVGHLSEGQVHVTGWHTPTLVPAWHEVRDPADPDQVGDSLWVA